MHVGILCDASSTCAASALDRLGNTVTAAAQTTIDGVHLLLLLQVHALCVDVTDKAAMTNALVQVSSPYHSQHRGRPDAFAAAE
jgi:hypothetical protein